MQGIIAGSTHKEVQLRTSKTGNPFATLTIRENVNGKPRWWQAIAFSEAAIDELRQLEAGAPVAVAGTIDAEVYAPAGSESRITWRVTVDAVLTAKAKRKPKDTPGEPSGFRPASGRKDLVGGKTHAERSWAAPQKAEFDDSIPF
jgi:hypothetical protein